MIFIQEKNFERGSRAVGEATDTARSRCKRRGSFDTPKFGADEIVGIDELSNFQANFRGHLKNGLGWITLKNEKNGIFLEILEKVQFFFSRKGNCTKVLGISSHALKPPNSFRAPKLWYWTFTLKVQIHTLGAYVDTFRNNTF